MMDRRFKPADGRRHLAKHDLLGHLRPAEQEELLGSALVQRFATGEVLFRTRLPGVPQGYPVTYAVDGKQYLAVAVGGGRVAGSANTLFVFAVPDV